jgi:hypothetical protein
MVRKPFYFFQTVNFKWPPASAEPVCNLALNVDDFLVCYQLLGAQVSGDLVQFL